MSDSPLQRLARLALEQDPAEWAAQQRSERYTWQQIADQLEAKIGVPVSRETIRLWANSHTAQAVTS